jgi:hypothetical protein
MKQKGQKKENIEKHCGDLQDIYNELEVKGRGGGHLWCSASVPLSNGRTTVQTMHRGKVVWKAKEEPVAGEYGMKQVRNLLT